MIPTLLGVDIGTSSIKAVAFTIAGRQLAKATAPTHTLYPRPDWAEHDIDEIWAGICSTLRELTSTLRTLDAEPAAIAFTSMAETAVPLDLHDRPLWFDRRNTAQMEWWIDQIGLDETAAITGLPVRTMFGILKLLWLRDNAAEAFGQLASWLNMADYGAFRLCGVKATDYSLASRLMTLDLAEKRWSTTLLDRIGVKEELFAELVPSGSLLGHVLPAAAEETGLPAGLPVCSGGHDHVCGSFALGITEPGVVFDSMGTAESLFLTTAAPNLDPALARAGIGQGIHVVPDRGYAMGGIFFSGGCVDWIRRILNRSAHDRSTDFEELIALARSTPPGSDGVFFLPHLRQANPPINDPLARGAFVGLSAEVGPGHFARAVLEGIAYEYQYAFESMMNAFDLTPRRLIATGGGSRNDLLIEIKSQVSGLPITIPDVEEATCLGAALLAGIGAGLFSSFDDAAAQVDFKRRTIQADAAMHGFYDSQFRNVYLGLYEALRESNHRISTQLR